VIDDEESIRYAFRRFSEHRGIPGIPGTPYLITEKSVDTLPISEDADGGGLLAASWSCVERLGIGGSPGDMPGKSRLSESAIPQFRGHHT